LTGKGLAWGGSLFRPEAAGYGCVYFAAEMLVTRGMGIEEQTCLVSGSGNVAQHTAEKLIQLGAKVLTLSDSAGHIFDPDGIDPEKLAHVKHLKNIRRGRIREYTDKYPAAVFTPADPSLDHNPLWGHRADCAFPCATQNEIGEKDAYALINNSVKLVCEGANMPCSSEAIAIFSRQENPLCAGQGRQCRGRGGQRTGDGPEQHAPELVGEEVDERLRIIIREIHRTCLETAEQYGTPGNYLNGANIAGFVKVVNAMVDQGVV